MTQYFLPEQKEQQGNDDPEKDDHGNLDHGGVRACPSLVPRIWTRKPTSSCRWWRSPPNGCTLSAVGYFKLHPPPPPKALSNYCLRSVKHSVSLQWFCVCSCMRGDTSKHNVRVCIPRMPPSPLPPPNRTHPGQQSVHRPDVVTHALALVSHAPVTIKERNSASV